MPANIQRLTKGPPDTKRCYSDLSPSSNPAPRMQSNHHLFQPHSPAFQSFSFEPISTLPCYHLPHLGVCPPGRGVCRPDGPQNRRCSRRVAGKTAGEAGRSCVGSRCQPRWRIEIPTVDHPARVTTLWLTERSTAFRALQMAVVLCLAAP